MYLSLAQGRLRGLLCTAGAVFALLFRQTKGRIDKKKAVLSSEYTFVPLSPDDSVHAHTAAPRGDSPSDQKKWAPNKESRGR